MNQKLIKGSHTSHFAPRTSQRGITLIALVITIIVLLILAGVTISMVLGDDGIISQAQEAKNKWENAANDEQDLLARLEGEIATTTMGSILPAGAKIIQADESKGMVMQDANKNEWVWIEVPKSIYDDATYNSNGANKPANSTDYAKIESVLRVYSSAYNDSNFSDIWYAMDGSNLVTENTDGLTDAQKALNNGTGLTYDEYINNRNSMYKSIYENGGFWVGRYEAGIGTNTFEISETDRDTMMSNNSPITKAVIKQCAFPYTYITCGQAQTLAEELSTGGKTSSVMFGIQWELMLKFIETKGFEGKTQGEKESLLKTDATSWGWYYGSDDFTLNRGKYRVWDMDPWVSFDVDSIDIDGEHVVNKVAKNGYVHLQTGISDKACVLNLYDVAGNYSEYVLSCYPEYYEYGHSVFRDCRIYNGSSYPEGQNPTYGEPTDGSTEYDFITFRPAMW